MTYVNVFGMVRNVAATLAVLLGLLSPGSVIAQPILYSFSGTGSGSIGMLGFSSAPFTIEVQADRSQVTSGGAGIWTVNDILSTIHVDGIGTATFTTGKRVFSNSNVDAVGFARRFDDMSGEDLLDMFSSELDGYGLVTSFGPVFSNVLGGLIQFRNQPSTLGNVEFTTFSNVTFVAVTVPEPSSIALAGAASVSATIGVLRRRRKRC